MPDIYLRFSSDTHFGWFLETRAFRAPPIFTCWVILMQPKCISQLTVGPFVKKVHFNVGNGPPPSPPLPFPSPLSISKLRSNSFKRSFDLKYSFFRNNYFEPGPYWIRQCSILHQKLKITIYNRATWQITEEAFVKNSHTWGKADSVSSFCSLIEAGQKNVS